MEKLLKIRNYAFCLNKFSGSKKRKKISLYDFSKFGQKPKEQFYDEIINDDNKIKLCNKVLSKIKRETIKELIYTNKQIPFKWQNKIGYQNLMLKMISKDDQFLSYIGYYPKNANINNRNKTNRPRTSSFPFFFNNNLTKISNCGINNFISRNKSNNFRTLKGDQKFIRSKSLNNFNILGNYPSFNKLKNRDNISDKENNSNLFFPNKTSIDIWKNNKQNSCKKNHDNNNEIEKNVINNHDNKLMKIQMRDFKQRLLLLRRNIYSNLVSSTSQSSTIKSRNVKQTNLSLNDNFNEMKKINNQLIKSFFQYKNNP